MRRGLTLLELVVVLAIIGILVALLMPAIQYSREAARRMSCANCLRQIAIATQTYESTYRLLPPSVSGAGGLFAIITPQLEQEGASLYASAEKLWDADRSVYFPQSIAGYHCPSDPSATVRDPATGFGATNFTCNIGTGFLWAGYDGAFQPLRPFPSQPDGNPPGSLGGPLTLGEIRDGTSNTAAVSEILVSDGTGHLRRAFWRTRTYYGLSDDRSLFCRLCADHGFLTFPNGRISSNNWDRGRPWFGTHSHTSYNHMLTPNGPSCINATVPSHGSNTVGSFHDNGVNVAFLDGHISFIHDTINAATWQALGSRNGHEEIVSLGED